MNAYLPDTNVLIDCGRDLAVRTRLESASRDGSKFVIAPSTLEELSRGVIAGGSVYFGENKAVFGWLQAQASNILDLPRPFMGRILGVPSKLGDVEIRHYVQLIDMIASSKTLDEFLKRKDKVGSAWSDLHQSVAIHDAMLDKEFDTLDRIAKLSNPFDLAAKFCETFGVPGSHPDPKLFRQRFSAAVEYAESSISKIKGGAKPRKNDPGRYGDFQLFFYLADPDIILLTGEDFSVDIKFSPQRTRIRRLDSLP